MPELLTMQDLTNGHLDVKALGEAANGDENTIVTTRTGNTYPSAERAINIMFQNGGLPATPFKTKALMTASALVDGKYAMVTDDTVNNGLYVKTAGVWVKSSYDPLAQAKEYTEGYAVAFKDSLLTLANKNIVADGLIKKDMYVSKVSGGATVEGAAGTAVYSLPVSQGTYVIKADGAHNSAVLGMLVDEFGWVAGQVKPIATLQKTNVENTLLVDIPQGIVELVITVKLPSVSLDMTSTLQVFRSADPNVQTEVTHIDDKPLADLEARENMALKTDILSYVSKDDIKILNKNIFTGANVVLGTYMQPTGVVDNAGHPSLHMGRVQVISGKTYTIGLGDLPVSGFEVFYSESDSVLNGSQKTKLAFTAQSSTLTKYVDVPESASPNLYLFFNVKVNAFDVRETLVINEGRYPDTTPLLDSIAGVKIPKYEGYDPITTPPLAGKGWVLIGDSITEHNYRATRNYEHHIKERVLGLRTYNYAQSGTYFSSFPDLADTIFNGGHDIDIISVAYGTNDYGEDRTMGEFSPTDTGAETFANHVFRMFNSLINKFPTKIIVAITPIPRDISYGRTGTPNLKGLLIVDYAEMIIKYAKHFGLPVLDLHSMSNLTPWTEEGNWHYFLADEIVTEPDGLHPNDAGQKVMANKIQPFLEAQVSQY